MPSFDNDTFEKICQLLLKGGDNTILGATLLKGAPKQLVQEVEDYFRPLLDLFHRKSAQSLPTIIKNIQEGKCSAQKQLALWATPWGQHNIKQLDFGYDSMDVLPESIGNLTNLEHLKIYHGKLTSIPESIGNLKQLKTLDLYSCGHLKALPESIGELEALESLDIAYTSISTLPKSI